MWMGMSCIIVFDPHQPMRKIAKPLLMRWPCIRVGFKMPQNIGCIGQIRQTALDETLHVFPLDLLHVRRPLCQRCCKSESSMSHAARGLNSDCLILLNVLIFTVERVG